jgi:hypothetical protein
LREVEAPTFSYIQLIDGAKLSALCAGRSLPPGRFKISTSSGTRTGDLPACSMVPQPTTLPGRAIAQAVSCWLPTAAARVRARVWQVGFGEDKVASGQVFSEYFGLSCQNRSFHQLLHHHNHPGQL